MLPERIDSVWLQRFRRNLRRWYAKHARDLPWRRTRDPYCVWISEIMLQQTTVAAAIPYYERFMDRFGDIHALAAATEEDVLRCWEGLGYYSRARNIHRTARHLSEQFDGYFPSDVQVLENLPGIGRYTAGAVASFAFDRRAPIVEANTLRLHCRLMGYGGNPRSKEGQNVLWALAERILPRKSPGQFNQALIELGATVCRPADPDCESCPVKSCCAAFSDGTQDEIPAPKQRLLVTDVTEVLVAVRKNGRYLLRRRPAGERWAGLWDFVRFEVDPADASAVIMSSRGRTAPRSIDGNEHFRTIVEERVSELIGLTVDVADPIAEVRHAVTRFRIRLLCLSGSFRSGRLTRAAKFRWVRPGEFDGLPLSVTGRKFARLIQQE